MIEYGVFKCILPNGKVCYWGDLIANEASGQSGAIAATEQAAIMESIEAGINPPSAMDVLLTQQATQQASRVTPPSTIPVAPVAPHTTGYVEGKGNPTGLDVKSGQFTYGQAGTPTFSVGAAPVSILPTNPMTGTPQQRAETLINASGQMTDRSGRPLEGAALLFSAGQDKLAEKGLLPTEHFGEMTNLNANQVGNAAIRAFYGDNKPERIDQAISEGRTVTMTPWGTYTLSEKGVPDVVHPDGSVDSPFIASLKALQGLDNRILTNVMQEQYLTGNKQSVASLLHDKGYESAAKEAPGHVDLARDIMIEAINKAGGYQNYINSIGFVGKIETGAAPTLKVGVPACP